MGYKEKAIKRAGIVFVISIIAAFIGYLIRMVLARELTPADYGLFFAAFTLFKFSGLFWKLGLDEALIKYIPDFQVKKKLEQIAYKYTSPYYIVVRAKAVLMAAQGLDNKTIGERLSLPRQIVSKWRKRFFEERLEGLTDRPRIGRSSDFSP